MSLKCTSILAVRATALLLGCTAIAGCKNNAETAPATDPPPSAPAQPAPVPTLGVVVQSAGDEPRSLLGFTSTAPEHFLLTFDTETKTKRGNLVSSTMNVTGTMTPSMAAESGTLQFAIAGISATDRDRQLIEAAGINHYLKDWQPPTFALGVTPAGDLGTDESAWKFPEILFNQEQALHDLVGKWLPVYPAEPIGHGATWTQTKRDIVNGVSVVRTTTFVLSRDNTDEGDGSTLGRHDVTATYSETAAPQQILIDGAPLQVARYAAEGTATYAYSLRDNSTAAFPWLGPVSGNVVVTMAFDNNGSEEAIVRTTSWTMVRATAKTKQPKAANKKP